MVANVEGTSGTVASANALKELLPRSAHVARKRAIIGVTGMKRFFLGSFAVIAGRSSVTPFDTIEQALEWVIKE